MGKYLELVEGSFTNEHYAKQDFSNYPYVAYSIADNKVIYTIVPNGTIYTVYIVKQKDISNISYNSVDLGLPSGLKWADKNVGATTPEEYGSYFAWGDTVGYTFEVKKMTADSLATLMQPIMFPDPLADDYVELTGENIGDILVEAGYEGSDLTNSGTGFIQGKIYNWSNYFDTTNNGSTFNKYSTDKLTVLESIDDAASVNMGANWRMPTEDEFQELIDNTTVTFIDIDGQEFTQDEAYGDSISEYNLKGIKLTGSNGNSIFIPAAGYCYDAMLYGMYGSGCLWSSSLDSSYSSNSHYLCFDCYGDLYMDYIYRCYGQSIRGVIG